MAEGVGTIDHAYISGPSHLRKTRGGNGNGNGNGNDDEEHELPTDIDEEEGSLSSSQSQHPQQGHEHEHGHGHGRGLETPSTFDDEPRLARIESNASRPREATELRELRRRRSSDSTSEASLSSNDYRATPRHIRSHTSTIRSTDGTVIDGVTGRPKRFQAIRRFWLRNINLEVPHKANRDYFGIPLSLSLDKIQPCIVVNMLTYTIVSPRKDVSLLHAHLRHVFHARDLHRTTLPSPVPHNPTIYVAHKFLFCWYPAERRLPNLRNLDCDSGRLSFLETAACDRS